MGLFDFLKKKEEEDDEIEIQIIDPEIEKQREEKFNIPVIEDEEEKKLNEALKNPKPALNHLPNYQAKKTAAYDTPYSLYKSRAILSPMTGRTEKKKEDEEEPKPKPTKKKMVYSDSDFLTPVISPMYGNKFPEKKKKKAKAVVEPVVEEVEVKEVEVELPTNKKTKKEVNQVEDTSIQDAIVEQKTGEYRFNFPDEPEEKEHILHEVEDEMTLDELLSLYEKKK